MAATQPARSAGCAPLRIFPLARIQLWDSNGSVLCQGPLPSGGAGWSSYVAPLGLDLTSDGVFTVYGYAGQVGIVPNATLPRGHYAILSDTKTNLTPIGQSGHLYPTTVGRRVVAAQGGQVVVQAAESSNPSAITWTPIIDTSGTGPSLRRTGRHRDRPHSGRRTHRGPGLPLKVRTPRAGKVTATGSVVPKRLGLKGTKQIVIATGASSAKPAGTVTLRLRLKKTALKYRARLRGGALVVRITQGGTTTRKSLRLRRAARGVGHHPIAHTGASTVGRGNGGRRGRGGRARAARARGGRTIGAGLTMAPMRATGSSGGRRWG